MLLPASPSLRIERFALELLPEPRRVVGIGNPIAVAPTPLPTRTILQDFVVRRGGPMLSSKCSTARPNILRTGEIGQSGRRPGVVMKNSHEEQ